MNDFYIQRHGYVEQVWKVTYIKNRFEMVVLIRGTEPEMQAYMESEFGYVGSYHALSKEEANQCKKMGFKTYIAPQL